ncbi:MAG: ATP-binding protein [Planctomycetota bacterium]
MADTTHKPVIFLAFANDRDDRDDRDGYLRNLPEEARQLRERLESAEQAGLCEVVVRSNCTAGDIFKVFQDPRYRNRVAIFHYGGHANGYQLLLESAEGQSAAADAGGLAAFLAQQQGLQLVFLNGCSTQSQTQGLLDANISVVISTSRAIDDKVATDFASQFYLGLASGATIRTAYHEAAASQQTAKGNNTRGLYFGSPDDPKNRLEADRWPWNLSLREGSESADQWNLPEAVNDPLFGLPPLPKQDLPESPYRHLNWFTRKDAEVFFGRGHQIRELYDRLTAPRTAPIMLFYGQSGVGKSSILDAGLIPRLEHNYTVRYLRRGDGGLLNTLQRAFSSEAGDMPIETAWRATEAQLQKPLIVFLDQVEELYTHPIAELPDELGQFLQVVKDLFGNPDHRPQGKLVLGFRKEWLAELETQLAAYELPRTKVFLEPLDHRGIIEVVRGPSHFERLREHYRLTIEDVLGGIIADDLLEDCGSSIAPTLQILLTKMWAEAIGKNSEHPHFSPDLYWQLRRDGILLRDFLNQQIAEFRKRFPDVVDSGLLLDILSLHTTPLGTAGQCTVEQMQKQYAHLDVKVTDLLQTAQDLYLLTLVTDTQKETAKTTRLVHDTLAPLVQDLFRVSQTSGQIARRILENRIELWKKNGQLLDVADLEAVTFGKSGMRACNENEEKLVMASQLRHKRQLRTNLNRRAKNYLRAIGHGNEITLAEMHEFRMLAKESRRVKYRLFRQAFTSSLRASRLADRLESVVRCTVGFDQKLRRQIHQLILKVLERKSNVETDVDIRLTCVNVGIRLESQRLENGVTFAEHAVHTFLDVLQRRALQRQAFSIGPSAPIPPPEAFVEMLPLLSSEAVLAAAKKLLEQMASTSSTDLPTLFEIWSPLTKRLPESAMEPIDSTARQLVPERDSDQLLTLVQALNELPAKHLENAMMSVVRRARQLIPTASSFELEVLGRTIALLSPRQAEATSLVVDKRARDLATTADLDELNRLAKALSHLPTNRVQQAVDKIAERAKELFPKYGGMWNLMNHTDGLISMPEQTGLSEAVAQRSVDLIDNSRLSDFCELAKHLPFFPPKWRQTIQESAYKRIGEVIDQETYNSEFDSFVPLLPTLFPKMSAPPTRVAQRLLQLLPDANEDETNGLEKTWASLRPQVAESEVEAVALHILEALALVKVVHQVAFLGRAMESLSPSWTERGLKIALDQIGRLVPKAMTWQLKVLSQILMSLPPQGSESARAQIIQRVNELVVTATKTDYDVSLLRVQVETLMLLLAADTQTVMLTAAWKVVELIPIVESGTTSLQILEETWASLSGRVNRSAFGEGVDQVMELIAVAKSEHLPIAAQVLSALSGAELELATDSFAQRCLELVPQVKDLMSLGKFLTTLSLLSPCPAEILMQAEQRAVELIPGAWPFHLQDFLKVSATLPTMLTAAATERVSQKLIELLDTADSFSLLMLPVNWSSLPPAFKAVAAERAAQRSFELIGHPDDDASLRSTFSLRALALHLNEQQLISLLKNPACIGSCQTPFLESLSNKVEPKPILPFGSIWQLADWMETRDAEQTSEREVKGDVEN